MQSKLNAAVIALLFSSTAMAQTDAKKAADTNGDLEEEQTFTFTESQLGDDDDMSQNVTLVNSNSNIYASQVGYLFSPVRFRYRAFDQKYNEIFVNGNPLNDLESGQFRYSHVGGLNQQTKSAEHSLPFEDNNFTMTSMGGSNNYNFRPSKMAAGHRFSLAGANRNYTVRAMYTFATGITKRGWSFAGNVTYRWAKQGYVEGTFYNSLSYYLGAEKIWDRHSLSLVTWGNPTERASQGGVTDEVYWLANDQYYNPYWGYQDGKKRNSRIVTEFAPTALLTWDYKMKDNVKLTTAFRETYSRYKGTKLNYNNSDNPQPNYWKNLPSSYYDVWDENDTNNRTESGVADWQRSYNWWTASKANRQIQWDNLYAANRNANAQGTDAMYFIQAKNNDQLVSTLSSNIDIQLNKNAKLNAGVMAQRTKGMHYQTMEDLLGAKSYHNINTYALGTYSMGDNEVQYDLNNPNAEVKEGDKFGYDYNLLVTKFTGWATIAGNYRYLHGFLSTRMSGEWMQRDGKMRNGLAASNSYGKSETAKFCDGGIKGGVTFNLGKGNTLTMGLGYEARAPQASKSFQAPEINNNFVRNLRNEKVFSAELGYQLDCSWLHANLNGYYSRMHDVTDWQNFYFDDINSFSYVSMTGMEKVAYGVEAGLNFKLTSAWSIKAFGTISEAKITDNTAVSYMNSTKATVYNDIVYNKNMRESGTPLTAASLGLSYHSGGWYIDLTGNYYDRIYLSYSPSYRYGSVLDTRQSVYGNVFDNNDNVLESAIEQAKGKGGFMLDASIGKSIYLKKGSLSINLTVTNMLNNRKICTGGYEQSRSDYTNSGNTRAYKFSQNPIKFYAYGTNGMLNVAYKF